MIKRDALADDHLKPLTSLRFVAALLVFLYHCKPTAAVGTAYALGHAGVGFFFLLSGFILTYTYHGRFSGGMSWDNVRAFYVARIARIYPLHLVGMGLAIAVLSWFGGTFWDRSDTVTRGMAFGAQTLLIQSWFPDERIYFGLNSPAWSISVEAFFYALFPFLVTSLLRSFGRRPPRTVLFAAALPWLILVIIALIPHRIAVWTAYIVPAVRLGDFVVGMMLGIAILRQREVATKIPTATILELAAIVVVIGAILISPIVPEALRYALFLMPFWALVIWAFASQRGAVSRLLSQPVFVRLGEISFAFYLVHWTVIQMVDRTIGWRDVALSMAVTLALTFGLSLALFSLVEQPLRNRIRLAFSGANPERSLLLPRRLHKAR